MRMLRFIGEKLSGNTDKVVSMDRFLNGRSLSPIRQAEAYWSALRVDGDIPHRSDIDPRGLGNILEYTFVLERIAPGIARFRLAGRHLSKVSGMEVRGMPLTALFSGNARAEIGATLEHIFDTPAIAELDLSAQRRFARAPLEARMILLPLLSDFGEVSRALGVLVTESDPDKRSSHSFDIKHSRIRNLDRTSEQVAHKPARVHGFAEEQKILEAKPALKLVVSRD